MEKLAYVRLKEIPEERLYRKSKQKESRQTHIRLGHIERTLTHTTTIMYYIGINSQKL